MKKPFKKTVISSRLYSRRYFLGDCEGYTNFLSNQGLTERLQQFLKEINPTEKDKISLDLGCGRGEIVYELSKKSKKVIGVDYSKDAIQLAKNKYKKSNIKFIQADVKKLPFKDSYFDLIVSSELLEHIHSWEQDLMFKEIRRILKPKGRIVIQTEPNKSHRYFSSFLSLIYRIWYSFKNKTKFSFLIERPHMHTIMNFHISRQKNSSINILN